MATQEAGGVPFPLDLDAVAAHLRDHGLALDPSAGAIRLRGGLSNLNDRIVVDGRPMVLRRPPMGDLPPGAHDMAREHRVLSVLWRAFPPAPRSFLLCEDRAVIGVPFQLLEHRTGLVVRGDVLPSELAAPKSRRELSLELVQTLAAFHAVEPASVGLSEFGRPQGFFLRTVAGWRKRGSLVEASAATAARIEAIGGWLERRAPRELTPTLLHSDMKLDNCMLGPDLRITTVLDWDMATRGDPSMDLATMLSYWAEPGDPPCMHRLAQMPTAAPGFLSRAEVVDAYARATGRDLGGFQPWRVLGMLKLGVVFLQLHRNWVRGVAGDAGYAGFGALGEDLVDFAHDLTTRTH